MRPRPPRRDEVAIIYNKSHNIDEAALPDMKELTPSP